jgi:hypothetical protein
VWSSGTWSSIQPAPSALNRESFGTWLLIAVAITIMVAIALWDIRPAIRAADPVLRCVFQRTTGCSYSPVRSANEQKYYQSSQSKNLHPELMRFSRRQQRFKEPVCSMTAFWSFIGLRGVTSYLLSEHHYIGRNKMSRSVWYSLRLGPFRIRELG